MSIAKRFQNKDSKYNGDDNEKIMEFKVLYDLESEDFNFSKQKTTVCIEIIP